MPKRKDSHRTLVALAPGKSQVGTLVHHGKHGSVIVNKGSRIGRLVVPHLNLVVTNLRSGKAVSWGDQAAERPTRV